MALAHAWTSAAYGRMPASEQAKLWGLREVLKKIGRNTQQWQWMANQVLVAGLGTCRAKPCGNSSSVLMPTKIGTPAELLPREAALEC